MELKKVRDLLQDVVTAGKMTKSAKERLQEAFKLVDDEVQATSGKAWLEEEGMTLGYASTEEVIANMEIMSTVLVEYPKSHNQAYDDVGRLDKARQDLYHGAEFLKGLTIEEKAANWDKIGLIAEERRGAKNFEEATQPLKLMLVKYPNLSKEFKKCIEQIKQVKNKQESRCYRPKQLTSMTEAFNEAAPVKENGQVITKEAN
ncbi:hypothetical protein BEYONPHE_36 [Bacillus phage Beyonphe]|nr:hypothetical protein BEYONPHE_36 [Bacillus phage Beyonphe]